MSDIRERTEHARELLRRGEWEAATTEYLWLWNNMLAYEQSLVGVRHSFLLGEMEELAGRSEHAREQFLALRDRYRPAVESPDCTRDNFTDWILLSRMLGDSAAALDWFEAADRTAEGVIRHLVHNRREFFQTLIEHGRWREAGEFLDEPLQILGDEIQVLRDIEERAAARRDSKHHDKAVDYCRSSLRKTASDLRRALHAADRRELAGRIQQRLKEALPR